MKHMLMNPAFPDLVAAAIAVEREKELRRPRNAPEPKPEDLADAFLTFLGKIRIGSTRLW
jgi:hypothetical protein